jgi:hypothetical protein
MRKSQVVPFVPVSCRGFRFSTYISGQRAWDDMPTYILDEWVAYANGASVGVEQVKAGNYTKGNCDGVSGCLEFTIYSFALAMSISKNDPNYFAQNNQFKAFMEWHAKRAMALFHEGIKMKEFQVGKQMTIFKNFTTGGDSTQLRNFIIKVWGQEFWDSVMLNKK